MKMNIRLPKARLLFACLLLFSLFPVHQSCTKIDTASPDRTPVQAAEKFFAMPAGTDPLVQRVARQMQAQNNAAEFISGFARDMGYAVWDKAQVGRVAAAASFQSSGVQGAAGDTIAIIPLVLENTALVNGYLKATISGSIQILQFRRDAYTAYPFGKGDGAAFTAERYQADMMRLDHAVFGYTIFDVTDRRLFAHQFPAGTDTAGRQRRVTLKDLPPQGNNLYEAALCTNVCILTLCPICHEVNCPYTTGVCWETCTSVGEGTSGGGPIGPGGGAGGYPTGGGPGTVPVTPPAPTVTPCQYVDKLLTQSHNFPLYLSILKDSLTLDHEKGFVFHNPLGPQPEAYEDVAGDPGQLGMDLIPIAFFDGLIHTHNNDPRRLSVFSADDLIGLYKLASSDSILLINPKTFTLTVITSTTSYIMMIDNPAKFLAFGNKLIDKNPLSENFIFKGAFYDGYLINASNTAAENEKNFLKALKGLDCGLKVFKGNNNLQSFSPIKLSSDDLTIVPDPCN